MQNFDLISADLHELNEKEVAEVQGGFLGFLAAAVVWVVIWCVANFVKDVIIEGEQFDMTQWWPFKKYERKILSYFSLKSK